MMGTWKGLKKTQYHRSRRHETVVWINSLRTACKVCGEPDPIVLDFHHRDSSKKKFTLSGSGCYSRSRKSIQEEIDKCDVLCANCHRRHHYNEKNNI